MIMKRLTPEDAYRALKENKTVYSVTEIEMTQDPMEVLDQIFGANDLIIFDEAAEKEPAEEGRTEPTATEQASLPEAVEKTKQARKEINIGWIITLRNEGKSAKEIAAETGYSIQSVYRYMPKRWNMRLIDADALIQVLCVNMDTGQQFNRATHCVDEMPTVDAVPVIRCKDCKWYEARIKRCNNSKSTEWKPDDYCSDAERREE